MFDKVLSAATYDDVLAFCRTYPEGVRAEYKRTPVNIPKIVSSFGNTVGGIWVIGVDTDGTNRAVLPAVGLPMSPGIEEQIVQSAQSGVYPGITPAVRIFEIPNSPGRVLAVVKVLESPDAPHAIENSTRVYMRVASTSDPIELSDIDRIKYLLERRQAPEAWRDALIERAVQMSIFTQNNLPRFRVVIAPMFPHGMLFPYDTLFERASALDQRGHRFVRNFRMVHEGIMAGRATDSRQSYHLEVSTHGVMLFEELYEPVGQVNQIPYIHLVSLIKPLIEALSTAVPFFDGALTNLLIRCELFHCHNVAYLEHDPRHMIMPEETAAEKRCLDQSIPVWTNTSAETLAQRRVQLVTDILKPMLWAFSHRQANLQQDVERWLASNRFV